jgi:hypothetical protein
MGGACSTYGREGRGACRVLVGKPEGKRPLGRNTITLKWIFKRWDEEAWTGLIWLRIGTGGGLWRMW